jgi:multidrug efflux system membrane fusion protein
VVDPGNYVTAASTSGIVVLNQITPISVLFSIPEDNIPALHAAIRAGNPIPVTLYDRADTTKLADGTLSTVDNQIDTSTGTLKMRAVFPNTDGELVPNQFVNVDMLVSQLQNVLSVPVNAIQTGAPGSYVYVVDADGIANVTAVTTGAQDSNRVQILSGLNPGDRVVTDGVDRLRDGIKVTIAGPVATAPVATAVRRHRRRRAGGYGGYGQGGSGGGYGGGYGQGGAAPAGGAPGGAAAGSGP